MLIGCYRTKDDLRHSLGQPLHFEETSMLVGEYTDFGTVAVVGPAVSGMPSWYAEVTLIDGHIVRVD